jgi:dTDP-4-dehydrorhamnose 3,5-epimerase
VEFRATSIDGAWLIVQEPRTDERGFFARAWSEEEFAWRGLTARFVQCNNSFSVRCGTLRGLHYQDEPYGEVKLVRCISGSIFDVIVDTRRDSPTYLRWFGVELSAANRQLLYVPAGCAHGYQTLEDQSEVLYPVSVPYMPAAERGIRWNDPLFGIAWPDTAERLISAKDERWPDFAAQGRG